MKKITFNQIDAIVRAQLIVQSELDSDFVRNLAGRYGAGFDEEVDDEIFDSISTSDTIIFFITEKHSSANDVSMTNEDDTITQYSSYDIRVSIYGDDAVQTATKVVARFRTSKVRSLMYDSGVHIRNIEEAGSINEIKNELTWLRADFIIHIDCEHEITQIDDDSLFTKLNNITEEELN